MKVDTNSPAAGSSDLVQHRLVNYVALDLKASLFNRQYHDAVVGRAGFAPLVRASLHLLRHHAAHIDWEARTTVCGRQHSEAQLLEIAAELRPGESLGFAGGASTSRFRSARAPQPALLQTAAQARLAGIEVIVR